MAVSELILLFLLYTNVKVIRKYLDTNNTLYIILAGVLMYVLFNMWIGMYTQIVGNFINQFKMITNIFTIIIIVGLVHVESMRKKEEKERIKTKEFFSKYVSESIVDSLLKQKGLQLGGKKQLVTVIFTDVRGFTSLSEKLDPQQIVSLLNGHFNIITEEILRYKGTLLKYIGDAAMAVFNVPIKQDNHAEFAVRACISIQKRMKLYSKKIRQKYGVDFHIGIGINTGDVVVGNIGSKKYMDYTIIGDAVNTASRLNGVAKKDEIVISQSTYEQTKGCRALKFSKPMTVSVKGKSKELKVYKVLYND